MFYTPVVAIVRVLGLAQGLLHLGTAETRVWAVPVLGFLAGFNSRKAAAVIDGLSEHTLGKLAQSMHKEGGTWAETVANVQQALRAPKDFDDIAVVAKATLDDLLKEHFGRLTP